MLKLVIEDGDGTTHVVPIIRDLITIGREEGNTIRLTERNVSRHHARLTRSSAESDATIILEDLDSYNGVRVNGVEVVRKQTLVPEDTVQIGDYFIVVESEGKAKDSPSLTDTMVTEIENTEELDPVLEPDQRGRLVVVSSNLAGTVYWLDRREMMIGRNDAEGNDLVIKHRSISRHHAKLIFRDGGYTLVDLASSNGVVVNRVAAGTTSLVNGDIIEMGHVKLRYCAPGDGYNFQMTDIDDVVVVSTGQSMGVILSILSLILIAGAAFLITTALDKDEIDPDSKAVSKATKRSSADPENTLLTTKLKPTSEAQEALIQEAERWMAKREWQTALNVFVRILEDPSLPPHARTKAQRDKEICLTESDNLKRFERIREIDASRASEAILTVEMPTDYSVYSVEAKLIREKVRSRHVEHLQEQFEANLRSEAWTLAASNIETMGRFEVEPSKVAEYRERLAEAVDGKAATKRPREPSKRAEPKKIKEPKKRKPATSEVSEPKPGPTQEEKPAQFKKDRSRFNLLKTRYQLNKNNESIAKDRKLLDNLCNLSVSIRNREAVLEYCQKRANIEKNTSIKKGYERLVEKWKSKK